MRVRLDEQILKVAGKGRWCEATVQGCESVTKLCGSVCEIEGHELKQRFIAIVMGSAPHSSKKCVFNSTFLEAPLTYDNCTRFKNVPYDDLIYFVKLSQQFL